MEYFVGAKFAACMSTLMVTKEKMLEFNSPSLWNAH